MNLISKCIHQRCTAKQRCVLTKKKISSPDSQTCSPRKENIACIKENSQHNCKYKLTWESESIQKGTNLVPWNMHSYSSSPSCSQVTNAIAGTARLQTQQYILKIKGILKTGYVKDNDIRRAHQLKQVKPCVEHCTFLPHITPHTACPDHQ
jgi:hypothetical protein